MKSSTFLVLGLRWLDESIGRKVRSKEGKRARPLVGFSVFELIFRLNALPNRVELKRCFVEHFKSYRTMCKVINFNGFKLVKNRSEKLKSLHLVDRWITWFHLLLRHQFIWKWSLNGLNAARHLINESCWQRCHLQQKATGVLRRFVCLSVTKSTDGSCSVSRLARWTMNVSGHPLEAAGSSSISPRIELLLPSRDKK